MRWKTHSPPVLSTCTAMPGYFASNDLAIFSASGRSTEEYQTTLPSRLAASISAGVTAVGSGAAARSGAAKTDSPAAAEVLRMVRLEIVCEGIRRTDFFVIASGAKQSPPWAPDRLAEIASLRSQ